jgi:hypothetical protein
MTNVDVYGFLEREIAESSRHAESTDETRKTVTEQAEIEKQPDMKPMRAGLVESEIAHVLSSMCAGTPGCKAIGLYNKSGLAFAFSSNTTARLPLGFVDAMWPKLVQRAKPGSTLVLDGQTLVVFPVKHGAAVCIVDP